MTCRRLYTALCHLRPGFGWAAVLLLGLGGAALAYAQATTVPPSLDRLREELIRNFAADQQAVLRYEHREYVLVRKNQTRDGRTLLVYFVNGHQVAETTAVDGRELTAAARAAEHRRAEARAAASAHRPPPPVGALEFNRKTYPFRKLAGDYVYGPARVEQWHGRTTWVYPAAPNPNATSRSREEQVLLSSRGEIWVDAEDHHVVRISMHTFEPVRYILGILATIHTASLDLQLARRAPGEWLPTEAYFDFDATILFFKDLRESKLQVFSTYQPLTGGPPAGVSSP